ASLPTSPTPRCTWRARSRDSSRASICSSTAAAASPARSRSADEVHLRVGVSAISTFQLDLPADLAFWEAHGITTAGVSVAKLEAYGWERGTQLVQRAVENGLRVADLIGLGPFHLANPSQWERQRERLVRSLDTARAVDAAQLVFTTGPFVPLTWDEAA